MKEKMRGCLAELAALSLVAILLGLTLWWCYSTIQDAANLPKALVARKAFFREMTDICGQDWVANAAWEGNPSDGKIVITATSVDDGKTLVLRYEDESMFGPSSLAERWLAVNRYRRVRLSFTGRIPSNLAPNDWIHPSSEEKARMLGMILEPDPADPSPSVHY